MKNIYESKEANKWESQEKEKFLIKFNDSENCDFDYQLLTLFFVVVVVDVEARVDLNMKGLLLGSLQEREGC